MSTPFCYLIRLISVTRGIKKCKLLSDTMRDQERPEEFLQRFLQHLFHAAIPRMREKRIEVILSNDTYSLTIHFEENNKIMILVSSSEQKYMKYVEYGNGIFSREKRFHSYCNPVHTGRYEELLAPLNWAYAIFPNLDASNEFEEIAKLRSW